MLRSRLGSYSVSGEHLSPVLVDDLDDAGRLDPGLSVYLYRNPLVPQDGDLHLPTLRASNEKEKTAVRGSSSQTIVLINCPESWPGIHKSVITESSIIIVSPF